MFGPDPVAQTIARFTPRTVSEEAASFARRATARARPSSVDRAKAFLFATSRLAAFAEAVGLSLDEETLFRSSVIERLCAPGVTAFTSPTRRTLRTNLRAVARCHTVVPPPVLLSRETAKPPYCEAEIAGYLAMADAQPTMARRRRAMALICLGAGAGLVGGDLRTVAGSDVVVRSGGVVVIVRSGRAPRAVPVLARYHDRLVWAARQTGEGFLVGGSAAGRHNVTSRLVASLAGGMDLPRLEVARLRSTWLAEVAGRIGLRPFLDAAGVSCSQRLGDVVATLTPLGEEEAVGVLGARRR